MISKKALKGNSKSFTVQITYANEANTKTYEIFNSIGRFLGVFLVIVI